MRWRTKVDTLRQEFSRWLARSLSSLPPFCLRKFGFQKDSIKFHTTLEQSPCKQRHCPISFDERRSCTVMGRASLLPILLPYSRVSCYLTYSPPIPPTYARARYSVVKRSRSLAASSVAASHVEFPKNLGFLCKRSTKR